MVSSGAKDGFVRSLAADLKALKRMEQLCNIRYDVLLTFKEHYDELRARMPRADQKRQEIYDQQKCFGILGPCVLRKCSMFDVGHSFMADSLHNVYIGAFVSYCLGFRIETNLWNTRKLSSSPITKASLFLEAHGQSLAIGGLPKRNLECLST